MIFQIECMNDEDEIIENGEIEADDLKQCIEALLKKWDELIPSETTTINIAVE